MNEITVIFPWNNNFETGIAIIDEQHQKLVDLLNKLASHLAYGSDSLTLNRVFDELADYAVYHFKTEEAIWHKYLPSEEMTVEHEQTHLSFVSDVLRIKQEQLSLPTEEVVESVVSFLTHWLAFHILETDKHMTKIVLAVQQGLPLEEARLRASSEMNGAMRVLIETILKMYDSLSSKTLQLMREIANRQRAEAQLRLSKDVIDSTLEAIFVTDAAGLLIDTNPAFCIDAGSTHEQLLGMNIRQIKPNLFTHDKAAEIWRTATSKGHWAGEILGRDASGEMQAGWLALSAIKDGHGIITHYVGVLSSIAQLIQRQHSLEKAANFDALTGLPNRRLLQDRLAQALMRSKRNGYLLAVCFLDLDGFKQVNDSLGHDAGDELLCLVAMRLAKLLRGDDTVARLGGDEFVLLLGDAQSELAVTQLLDRLLQDIAQPFALKGGCATVSASIGVTLYPHDLSVPEQLLEHADQAMYQAKNSGKSRYHFYKN